MISSTPQSHDDSPAMAPAANDGGSAPTLRRALSACWHLFLLTIRRQLMSRQTLVGIALAILCALIVIAGTRQKDPSPKKLAEQVLVPTYIGFLMPILAICYGASTVGGEREDRTLIYLLITPMPRPLIYLTKTLSTIGLVSAWSGITLASLCWLARDAGQSTFHVFLAASLFGSAAYAALFLMLGAIFRHGTVIALAYWFFLEVLFGNMPGIIKRVSVAFYVRCMVYDAGSDLQIGPWGKTAREMFLPVSGRAASITLVCATLFLVAAGTVVFSRREYRDLS